MKGFKEREREQDHFSVHSKKAAETIEKTRRTGARVLILLGILLCAFYLSFLFANILKNCCTPNIYLSICAILTFHCLLSDILSVVFVVSYYVSVTKMAF